MKSRIQKWKIEKGKGEVTEQHIAGFSNDRRLGAEQEQKSVFEHVEGTVKVYSYAYEDYESGEKGVQSMVEDILADPDFPGLTDLAVGDWGDTWDESCQPILDGIVEHAEQFSHI